MPAPKLALPVFVVLAAFAAAPTASAATLDIKAEADATVAEATPTTRLGTGTVLDTDGSPRKYALVRFTVGGCTAAPTKATLMVRTIADAGAMTTDGPKLYTTGTSWTESSVTWATRPANGTTVLADIGAMNSSTLYSMPVTSTVKSNGTFAFALLGAPDGTNFHSRDSGTNGPVLKVECSTTTTPPPTPPASQFPTATSTGVPAGTTLRVVGANAPVPGTTLKTDAAGDLTITTAGVVIDRIDLAGQIKVRAADVTIRNSYLRGPKNGGTTDTGIIDSVNAGVKRLIIENNTLIAQRPSIYLDGVKGHDYTARGNKVMNTVDAFGVFNTTGDKVYANVVIDRNYATDLVRFATDHVHTDGTHNDIVQVQGGRNIRITNNNFRGFLAPGKGNYDAAKPQSGNVIIVQCNVSPVGDIIIENNLITGGMAAGIFLRRDKHCNDMKVTYTVRNNRLGRDQWDHGNGSRYPIRIQNKANIVVTGLFTNVWNDTGKALAEGRDLGIRYDG
ncbi:MAG: parallel beta-helix repeat protein [Thermoleophilia bacterium]|nr:parallel beta-helix repeat protein [Thermoleophilia bacterium]MCZ4496402.1 parallel beta-helix repeat protein [Thermoleophilia bacterium]